MDTTTGNAIFTIDCYLDGNTWFFDDKARGIQREAFVCGASELISLLAQKAGYESGVKNIRIAFSETMIPGYDCHITAIQKDYPHIPSGEFKSFAGVGLVEIFMPDETAPATSATYVDEEGNKCWLCPAQLKFFNHVADHIYAKIIT